MRRALALLPFILACGGLDRTQPVDGGVPDEMPVPACTASLSIDRSSLMLGTIASVSVASGTVTLTNASACPSGDVTVSTSPGISASGCSGPLAAQSSCTLTITADPTKANQASGMVSITANPGTLSPLQLVVAWIVVYRPPFSAHPAAFELGPIPLGLPVAPIQVTVYSLTTLTDLSVATSGPDISIDPASTTCGSTLPAKDSCVVGITFLATSVGERSNGVTVAAGGAQGETFTIPITAKVVSGVHLVLDPPGPQGGGALPGGSAELPLFTVGNQGNRSTESLALTITGRDAAEFSLTSTCTTLAPLETCKVAVLFRPAVGSVGWRTALLEVRDTGPSNAVVTGGLTGTLIPPY